MTERDYAESLKSKFGMEIQSEAFGFNRNLSIEGSTCEYHNKQHNDEINEGNMKIDFHSKFQMTSAKNAATTFENMKKFIHWMNENNLFMKDGIIYDTT